MVGEMSAFLSGAFGARDVWEGLFTGQTYSKLLDLKSVGHRMFWEPEELVE